MPVNGTVQAHPGYFALEMENGIYAEMTVSNRTALYRFTFPEKPVENDVPLNPVIMQNMEDLANSRIDGSLAVDNSTGRMTGYGVYGPSFGVGNFAMYFCTDFQGAKLRDTGTYDSGHTKKESYIRPLRGAYARFTLDQGMSIYARVGISFISSNQACQNAENEIPDFNFNATLENAKQAWRSKFAPVELDPGGVNDDMQTVFWSGIYRTMISPQDYTGENPLWNSSEPYYDSWYCIWDSFRTSHPLLTIIDSHTQARMIRALIDIYEHEGWLPDCRMSLCKGLTQGGSNADVVLADSYLKGISEGINWEKGYEAVVKDAEVEPGDWDVEGRGNLESYKKLGYIPVDDNDGAGMQTRSISRTVEYGYNDFVIAEMAREMGKQDDAEKYFNRSRSWENLYKNDQDSFLPGTVETDTGFKGFLQPRKVNGDWDFQYPAWCSPIDDPDGCYLNPLGRETYEGSVWLYTFFVPGDIGALVKIWGREQFVDRLDYLHDKNLVYMGNENGLLTVYLYHYAGRPGKSAYRAYDYITRLYTTSTSGIPGNDDSGGLGSFAALSMMGTFPNAGQNVYFIIPPFFKEVRLTSPQTGRTATIRNVNFDPTYKAIYIQNATLDGKPYSKNWIDHSFFLEGKTLELTLGIEESNWGTASEDSPPSMSSGGPNAGVKTGTGSLIAKGLS
jgi:predicted alpha-1,2-mannosidase